MEFWTARSEEGTRQEWGPAGFVGQPSSRPEGLQELCGCPALSAIRRAYWQPATRSSGSNGEQHAIAEASKHGFRCAGRGSHVKAVAIGRDASECPHIYPDRHWPTGLRAEQFHEAFDRANDARFQVDYCRDGPDVPAALSRKIPSSLQRCAANRCRFVDPMKLLEP